MRDDRHPFSIADLAQATARLLGDDWTASASHWGTAGYLRSALATRFTLETDERRSDEGGDLAITFTPDPTDGLPEDVVLPEGVVRDEGGVRFEDATPGHGIGRLAELCASTIRAVIGQPDPAPYSGGPADVQLDPGIRARIEELLERWDEAAGEDGSSDAEHEVGIEMSELLWRLHGSLPERG